MEQSHGGASDTGFVPIHPNPFIVGNPVRGRAMFFGREAEFELVRKRFQDSSHGGLLVFCGERRSGKAHESTQRDAQHIKQRVAKRL